MGVFHLKKERKGSGGIKEKLRSELEKKN